MTAYQLMIINEVRRYVPIKIRNHSNFIIDSNLLQEHLATLKEIDLLTSQYDENAFRISLEKEKLIDSSIINNRIAIRFQKKGKMETISDSLLFKDAKQYLDVESLENTLKILCNNRDFVNSLLTKYLPKNDGIYNTREYVNLDTLKALEATVNSNVNFYRLKNFLILYRNIIDRNLINNLYHCTTNDITTALIKIFYYNEIYSRKYIRDNHYNQGYNDYGDYYAFDKEKIQYKRLHNLAKFIYDYDKRRQKAEEEHECQEEFLEPGELSFKEETVIIPTINKPKKRIKKPLDGQISFFD